MELLLCIVKLSEMKLCEVNNGSVCACPDETRKSGKRLVGDVDFEAVKSVASWITPVPGGVGPMTVVMLLSNTVLCAERLMHQQVSVCLSVCICLSLSLPPLSLCLFVCLSVVSGGVNGTSDCCNAVCVFACMSL